MRASVGRHLVLLPLLAISALPIYILVVGAFKTSQDILADPLGLPIQGFTLDNIVEAATSPTLDAGWSLVRTVLITVGSVAISTAAGAMISYVLSRSIRDVRFVYAFLVFGILVPSQVLLIPAIRILGLLQLNNTLLGLILYLAAAQVPYAVFLYTGFFRSVPRELDEAAFVDGAGPWRAFWYVIFPVLRPATASIAIFSGLGAFNNFVDPFVILGPTGGSTITTGIYATVGIRAVDYGAVFGSLLVAILPVMVAYVFLQKQFINGIADGSLKG